MARDKRHHFKRSVLPRTAQSTSGTRTVSSMFRVLVQVIIVISAFASASPASQEEKVQNLHNGPLDDMEKKTNWVPFDMKKHGEASEPLLKSGKWSDDSNEKPLPSKKEEESPSPDDDELISLILGPSDKLTPPPPEDSDEEVPKPPSTLKRSSKDEPEDSDEHDPIIPLLGRRTADDELIPPKPEDSDEEDPIPLLGRRAGTVPPDDYSDEHDPIPLLGRQAPGTPAPDDYSDEHDPIPLLGRRVDAKSSTTSPPDDSDTDELIQLFTKRPDKEELTSPPPKVLFKDEVISLSTKRSDKEALTTSSPDKVMFIQLPDEEVRVQPPPLIPEKVVLIQLPPKSPKKDVLVPPPPVHSDQDVLIDLPPERNDKEVLIPPPPIRVGPDGVVLVPIEQNPDVPFSPSSVIDLLPVAESNDILDSPLLSALSGGRLPSTNVQILTMELTSSKERPKRSPQKVKLVALNDVVGSQNVPVLVEPSRGGTRPSGQQSWGGSWGGSNGFAYGYGGFDYPPAQALPVYIAKCPPSLLYNYFISPNHPCVASQREQLVQAPPGYAPQVAQDAAVHDQGDIDIPAQFVRSSRPAQEQPAGQARPGQAPVWTY